MWIASVAGELPDHHYTQDELIAGIIQFWAEQHHNPDRLVRLHEAVQVGGRNLALPMDQYQNMSFGEANDAFIRVGTEIGERAIRKALKEANLEPKDVDVIFTTTVTGIATPSLDARLVNRLGLRSDVKRVPMFGLGCVAGAEHLSHERLPRRPPRPSGCIAERRTLFAHTAARRLLCTQHDCQWLVRRWCSCRGWSWEQPRA